MYVDEGLSPDKIFKKLGEVIKLSRAIQCTYQDAIIIKMMEEIQKGPNKDVQLTSQQIMDATGLSLSDFSRAKGRINRGDNPYHILKTAISKSQFTYKLIRQ